MRRFVASVSLLAALLVAPALTAQDGRQAPRRPAVAGTYAVHGELAQGGGVYSGTLVVEAQDDGSLRARYDLGADAVRPESPATLDGQTLVVRWTIEGGLAGAIEGVQGPREVEARYDLRANQGRLTLGGQPFARERLDRLTRLIVLHTNDSHGQVIPFKDATTGRRIGGFAARATLVKRIRREAERIGAHVLLLDAGDVNTGVPESDLLDAMPDLEAMNAMGYHAMAVGNHEFDVGLNGVAAQRRIARFPWLSANVLSEATGEPMFQPSLVLEKGGLRVGIFGLTTESAAYITLPENRAGLRFEPALEAAAREVPRLRGRCDVLIALTHLGYYADGAHGTSTPGDVNLARAVKGIDLIVGGHTHTPLPPLVDSGTIIVQAQDRGRFLGRVDLLLDGGKKLVRHTAALIPVVVEDAANPQSVVAEDEGVRDLIKPFIDQVNGRLDEVVATSPVVLDAERARVRAGDTNLAFLVTDAYRHAGGADISFAIGGGIRSSIDAGPITYREVLTTLPFGNGLVKGKLTGAQVLEVLGIGARQVPPAGAWLHVSGITWTMDAGRVVEARVDGVPLDPARVYTVVCDRFMADGGEKYTPFAGMTERQSLPGVDSDALKAFLVARGVPDYTGQRRCTVVSTIAAPAPTPAPAPDH